MAVVGEPGDLGRQVFDTKFLGIATLQWWYDLTIWERLFGALRFEHVVELGTGRGGMTLYLLMQAMNQGADFSTFDHVYPEMANTPVGRALDLAGYCHTGDMWSELISGEIREILADDANHPLLMLCDGGNKPREFQTFAPLLRAEDVVVVHDWGNEFGEGDIPEAMQGRLEQFMPEATATGKVLTRWWKVIA